MVKMKESNARVEQQRVEREKEREKAAKEKARDREMRLSALNAAHEEALNELQKKIQLKVANHHHPHQVDDHLFVCSMIKVNADIKSC